MWYKECALFKLEHYTELLHKLKIFTDDEKSEILAKIQSYKSMYKTKE